MRRLIAPIACSSAIHLALFAILAKDRRTPIAPVAERAVQVALRIVPQPARPSQPAQPPAPPERLESEDPEGHGPARSRRPVGPRSPSLPQRSEPRPPAATTDSGGGEVTIGPRAPSAADRPLDLGVSIPAAPPVIAAPSPIAPALPEADRGGGLQLRPTEGGGYVVKEDAFTARIAPDGSLHFEDHFPDVGASHQGPHLEVDLTEVLMRAAGDDPYRYEKDKIARDTLALRAEMSTRACKERLDQSVLEIGLRLDAIHRDARKTEAERRASIFELWDDCSEEGAGDVLLASMQIRAAIIAYVRRHLPEGSPSAFTAIELDRLNARRRSTARFQPYAIH